MKKQFIHNAAALTASAFITRGAGLLFRAYAAGKTGAAGMGLYSLVMTVFAFCSSAVTAAFNLASTRLVSDGFAVNAPPRAVYALRRCLALCAVFSAAAAALLYFGAQSISEYILKDARCAAPLRILAFGLPFMALSACLRGYFFARRKAFFSAGGQLIEQAAEIAVFALLTDRLLLPGGEYGCCALAAGAAAGEVISCGYSAALYLHDARRLNAGAEKYGGFMRRFRKIALPVAASSCLRSGLSLAENVLIPPGLSKYGADRETSLARYGELAGLAMPLITFPDVFLYCFTTLMIPEMSDAGINRRVNGIRHMAERVLGVTFAFSIGTAVFFYFFGGLIAPLIFKSAGIGRLAVLLSPVIPLIYTDRVVDGMLKGLGEQLRYLAYNIADSVMRVALTLTLTPLLGVRGIITVIYASAVLNSSLSLARLIRVTRLRINLLRQIALPLLAAVCICLFLKPLETPDARCTAAARCLIFAVLYGAVNISVFDNK